MANLLFLLGHIGLSVATRFRLINSKDVGQVSGHYVSLFTPAGFTFSIWGVIYTALLALCIRHCTIAFSRPPGHPGNRELLQIDIWFILNNIFTAAWLLVWTQERIALAACLIICQLLTLVIMHLRLGIFQPTAGIGSRIFTQFPLSIYLGWISVATIANISVYLVAIGWDGAGISELTWTRIMIAAVTVLTLLMVFARKNIFFGLVVIWALWGIISKRETEGTLVYQDIIETGWIAIGIIATACLAQLAGMTRKRRNR